MNSVIAHKGFITFLIISGIIFTTLIGFNLISKTQSYSTNASNGDSEPLEITTTNISQNGARVSWKSKNAMIGSVVYSNKPDYCEIKYDDNCLEIKTDNESTEHTVDLFNLLPDNTYYYKIKTKTGTYYPEGIPISFTTIKADEIVDEKNNTYYVRKYTGPDYFGIIPQEITKIIDLVGGNKVEDTKQNDTKNDEINDSNVPGKDTESNTDSENINPDDLKKSENVTPDVLGISTSDFVGQLVSEEFYTALKYGDKKYDFNKDGTVDILDYPLFIEFISNRDD
jgi:hypothetical protein